MRVQAFDQNTREKLLDEDLWSILDAASLRPIVPGTTDKLRNVRFEVRNEMDGLIIGHYSVCPHCGVSVGTPRDRKI